jgi:hypothetical protein
MTHFKKCDTGKLCMILMSFLLFCPFVLAQDYQMIRQNALDKLDLSGLNSTLFMNAAVTTRREINYLSNISLGNTQKPVSVSAEEWHNLFERLYDADLRPKERRLPHLEKLIETNPSKLTRNDTIPFGFLDLEAIYLTDKQLQFNENEKRAGRKVNTDSYERFQIIYAAALQQDVYQSDVWFKISPKFFITNHFQSLTSIAIDFNDGKGFTKYSFQEQLINHHFETIGKHPITVRMMTATRKFDFETYVDVRQVERIPPALEFHVSAPATRLDSTYANARIQIVGATIRVITGCDAILDKPVIIGEGFDMANEINLDALEPIFRTPLQQWLSEGYDLVLIDYDDARAAIENNAQVMKAVIQQINSIKQGSVDNIVIGASMSGLVARYAIRKMEVDGIQHHVKLLICYDTPHQGANVPVGMTQLLWESNATLLAQVILKFFAKGWRNYYNAMATPAASQMLLHWGGASTGGVGSKSPAFNAFRSNLNNLGNNGYPQNCRNIAVINGSMNAQENGMLTGYNYGDRILRSWTPFGLQNSNIDVHTNTPGQNTNVCRFATWGIFTRRIGISLSYNSSFNDDFLPGGITSYPVPNKLFFDTSSFPFCFVPTFSSIDYTGPISTQNQRKLLDIIAVNAVNGPARQTPFVAIYGQNVNREHIDTQNTNWTTIGQSENLLAGGTTCPALPIPPQPIISVYNVCYPFNQSRATEGNTANISVSLATPSGGQYIHNWLILPTQQTFTTTGDQITFQAEQPGQYQVICTRTYPNRRDLESTHTVTFTVTTCGDPLDIPENPQIPPQVDPDISIFDIWEDDFLLTTPKPDSSAVFAHYEGTLPAILYASKANATFVPASELEAAGMFPEFAELFAEQDPRDPLPVTLSAFAAMRESNSNVLTWTTTSEINSDHFEIQWSSDAKSWQKVGEVDCQKTEASVLHYVFTDPEIRAGTSYYRLKMVDADNSFAYSRICTIESERSRIVVFPNPLEAGKPLTFLTANKTIGKLTFFDLSGKIVLESTGTPTTANLQTLPAGRYLIKAVFTDDTTASQLIIKR